MEKLEIVKKSYIIGKRIKLEKKKRKAEHKKFFYVLK